ncbi:transthyretin-like family protein [Tessaracoccus sp. G1721]
MLPTAVRTALAATLVAALALIAAPAHAAPSTLKAAFDYDGSEVRISGTLTSDGDPVKREKVVASLDGREMDSDKTDGDGEFSMSFDIPSDLPAGKHVVAVEFGGSRGADPASAQTTITVGSTPPPTDGGDNGGDDNGGGNDNGGSDTAAPSKPAPDEDNEPAQPTALTLTAEAPATAVNGSLVRILGRLTGPSGDGVGNAGITVSDAGGEVEESFTVTTSSGAYEALYAVPEAQPAGTLTLTLSFAGTSGLKPASAQVSIAVEHTVVPTATPSPTPTATPTPSATLTPTASASPSAEAGTTPATPPEDLTGPVSWFLLTSVVVGGSALLATAFLVFRSTRGSRLLPEEAGGIAFLDDDNATDADGVSQTEVLDGMLGGAVVEDEPTRPIRPARAMPDDEA